MVGQNARGKKSVVCLLDMALQVGVMLSLTSHGWDRCCSELVGKPITDREACLGSPPRTTWKLSGASELNPFNGSWRITASEYQSNFLSAPHGGLRCASTPEISWVEEEGRRNGQPEGLGARLPVVCLDVDGRMHVPLS